MPHLNRNSDAVVVVKPDSGRHPVVSRTGIHGSGDHLVVINPATFLALPSLSSVKRADHNRLRSGHIVDKFLRRGYVHLDLSGRQLKHSRLPASSTVNLNGFGERPAGITGEHHLDPAILVRVRKVVVPFLVPPLVGKEDTAIVQLDEIRIHIDLLVLANRRDSGRSLHQQTCVRPGLPAILATADIDIPTEMVVLKGHQESPVGKPFDTRVVEILLDKSFACHVDGCHLSERGAVPGYSHIIGLRPFLPAASNGQKDEGRNDSFMQLQHIQVFISSL